LRITDLHLAIGVALHLSILIDDRLTGMVIGGVELTAVGGQPSGVVDFIELSGRGHGTSADFDVLVAQRVGHMDRSPDRRNAGRKLDS
jgi:hypothetical protein